ncbi:MAG: ATP-binding protein [Sulfurimicrobium sp.]|nr:ATP-binding protein [Sulfurimicrobium sp.]MDP2200070.1 ATP-binding protein [Sulfurimicrobium sp.]MDP3687862.1 ATP-binding protein [Sulfurimicrobium sp.]
MNLLVNAAHAIEERGTITIRTGHQADEVWVEVADTGKGIVPENLKNIFDPFSPPSPSEKARGRACPCPTASYRNTMGVLRCRAKSARVPPPSESGCRSGSRSLNRHDFEVGNGDLKVLPGPMLEYWPR